MNKLSIVNLKCPCFLFRYPNLDIASQVLFNLHRASALPLWCGSEDDQNFQSPPGHSRRPVRWRRYCMVLVCHSDEVISVTFVERSSILNGTWKNICKKKSHILFWFSIKGIKISEIQNFLRTSWASVISTKIYSTLLSGCRQPLVMKLRYLNSFETQKVKFW